MCDDTTKLNKSKLGTKQYWDQFYELEKKNFEENPEDTGECWFADNDAEANMVEFLMENVGQHRISQNCSILDLGTGNGHLLFQIFEEGFQGKLVGVDYSEHSVQFANEILKNKYNGDTHLSFHTADIFDHSWAPGQFDVVLDKGTLDAIALSGLALEGGKTVVEAYSSVIESLLPPNGVFLITSCNFTQDELIKIIESDNLKVWNTIEYPVFEFGGVKGTTICSVAFKMQ
ncbi:LAMI_0E10308g1_1 [Lachancea mirantina]|uniref:Protein-lysine N-methyltransferase EFM4 n=1 Tax=Lachancea mirantina TaxID=1230905 RepID=A0A1G4JP53_9SACH|nr:LAMI_0E10308g1_1 [Lachancea mirantina]